MSTQGNIHFQMSAGGKDADSAPNPKSRPTWIYVLAWLSIGCTMVIFNKALLSTWHFGFPFFLTSCHTIFASLMTQVLYRIYPDWFPGVQSGKVTYSLFAFKLVPVAVFFAGGLVLGNSAYKYISVSYIQMLKSLTPVPTLLVSFVIGREVPSLVQAIIVIVITSGIVLASIGELHFSLLGFGLQLSAMMSDICRTFTLDTLLVDIKLDALSTLFYMAPPSAILISTGFMFREYSTFQWDRMTPFFVSVLGANACVAFALNIALVSLLACTSPVTVSLFGLLKDIMLVILSVLLFGSTVAPIQIVGYVITIIGLNVYKNFKQDPSLLHVYLATLWGKFVGTCLLRTTPLDLMMFLVNGVSILRAASAVDKAPSATATAHVAARTTAAEVELMEAGASDENVNLSDITERTSMLPR